MNKRKKLIEVALPLEAINREAAREKSIRHGHPSTLHLWWARRPLAACRAVLFASLVDDPSAHPDRFPDEESQAKERRRLFDLIEALVRWENSDSDELLAAARAEIMSSCDGNLPSVLDPFAGGGSIPLEAQRLGLEAHASDLNPVAVLINKALVEIPPLFADRPPVHPDDQEGDPRLKTWAGAQGLADDVRYYGKWIRDEAERRIGHLYPTVQLPPEHGGGDATVIAWIWARTVTCRNPACGAELPLLNSFALSRRKGREAWIELIPGDRTRAIGVRLRTGPGCPKEGTVGRSGARCASCSTHMALSEVRAQAQSGGLGVRLICTIAEGSQGRIYVPSSRREHEAVAAVRRPSGVLESELPRQALGFRVQGYGLRKHADLFTNRQLVALTTFSDLVAEARARVLADGGEAEYADAVATYLALSVGRLANRCSSQCFWSAGGEKVEQVFARNALPMVWVFAEANPFSSSSGNYLGQVEYLAEALSRVPASVPATAQQLDAAAVDVSRKAMVATDPPYYDNVPYADLSDFFYVWLRRCARSLHPELFSTLLVPKTQELIAEPARHGSWEAAAEHFEQGLRAVFARLMEVQLPAFPLTLFYAYRQAEAADGGGQKSTGWERMLQALVDTGWTITATWPVRTEQPGGLRIVGRSALASSIVLVCRPRPDDAPLATVKEFLAALRAELPTAVRTMLEGNVAPVDLAQSSIGPGMAVFSRHTRVVEADGAAMPVGTALALINQVLDEAITGTDVDFDPETRWAVTWFEDAGMDEGDYGRAEQLSKARNTSVEGLARAGIIGQRPGKVWLVPRDELPTDWDPKTDPRLTVWEITQHLIRRLADGEAAAASLLRQVGSGLGETAKELAYRLYLVCDRRSWAQEAIAYNALVAAWPELTRLAALDGPGDEARTLFEE
jgi:putative DNA methylase